MIDGSIKGVMNILGFGKTKKRSSDNVAYWLNSEEARDIIVPYGYVPLSKNEEVRKCTHKIADLVSSMTIMLMENGEDGDRRLKNQLSKKIDVNPNKNMIRKNFIYKIVIDMLNNGNSVVFPKIAENLIDNLVIWKIDSVSFSGDEEAYTIKYKSRVYNPDELLHFVMIPDDDYPFKGQGFANALKDTIENLVQANATKKDFLRSKWKPSLIIKVETDSEDMMDSDKRSKILGSYVGDTKAGEPWLIPASEMDVTQVKPLTLQDLAIQESITLDKKAIASAFGVPSFMIGVGDFKIEEYNNFISSVIMPIAKSIEQELTKKLVYKPTWYFKFNFKSLMQYNLGEKTAHVKEMVSLGSMNRNEARNEFDYSPVDGLSEHIVLENFIPVADVGNQKKLDNKEPASGEGGDE